MSTSHGGPRNAARCRPSRFPALYALILLTAAAACASDDRSGAEAAQVGSPEERAGAALLFGADPGGLSMADQVGILTTLALRVSEDGQALVEEVCGQTVSWEVERRDLNADGTDEVLVQYGNTCLFGMAGTSVLLFVRDADGSFRQHLGLPGMIAEVRSEGAQGWPDLLIGGPGFCFGVWRWSGSTYEHHKNEPQAPGGCEGIGA